MNAEAMMVRFGYKLMSEEHGHAIWSPMRSRLRRRASISFRSPDHFHPCLRLRDIPPFAWSVLGAIAHATERVSITTGLTCPIIRYHPAIIAQAAATIGLLSNNRFTLAIGAGERLNEHITGARWPSVPERLEMLAEAVDYFQTAVERRRAHA